MTALEGWDNFYVIVGSSAGALIGLQFVVMTLLADTPMARTDVQASQAFGSPNVVHFEAVLFLSAIVIAPWHGITIIAALWGAMGLGGVAYSMVVALRMRRQTAYHAVFEDWLFHLLLPLTSYAMFAVSAGAAHWHPRRATFLVGAAVLLLLYVGIHNAWDTVTYHVFVRRREQREADQKR